jgi:hypothetical protein
MVNQNTFDEIAQGTEKKHRPLNSFKNHPYLSHLISFRLQVLRGQCGRVPRPRGHPAPVVEVLVRDGQKAQRHVHLVQQTLQRSVRCRIRLM